MFDLDPVIRSSHYTRLVETVLRIPALTRGEPSELWVNGTKQRSVEGWRRALETARYESSVSWNEGEIDRGLRVAPQQQIVNFTLPAGFARVVDALDIMTAFPFESCSLGSGFWHAWKIAGYKTWGLGQLGGHGWACGFRGAGHDRLVSRRWLEFGPWRVIRRANDTTFVQFYDLAIDDPEAAHQQATVGHQRMGIDAAGGYIGGIDPEVFREELPEGVYRADERTLDIVVAPGIDVSQQQMRVACGLRIYHRDMNVTHDRVDHVAYVFIDKADAERHLHELWLRELQCWYVDERGKHRLDIDYHPTPSPPPWVNDVEAREGTDQPNRAR